MVMMPIAGQLPEKCPSASLATNDSYLLREVAPLVQHFACISYNLIVKTVKNKSTNESLSRAEKQIVQTVEKTYAQEVEKARALIFNSDPSEQKKALFAFGN